VWRWHPRARENGVVLTDLRAQDPLCGLAALRDTRAAEYGYGAFSKPRTPTDPCPGYFRDGCGQPERDAWLEVRENLRAQRSELLAGLQAEGCVWPADLEAMITTTEAYAIQYDAATTAGVTDYEDLYFSLFGAAAPPDRPYDAIVAIDLELISRLQCELARLENLAAAQGCKSKRPDPVPPASRSWAPLLIGAGILIALVQGVRFGASIRR